jgi:hypothetical protein
MNFFFDYYRGLARINKEDLFFKAILPLLIRYIEMRISINNYEYLCLRTVFRGLVRKKGRTG